jgi:O-antigen ligase
LKIVLATQSAESRNEASAASSGVDAPPESPQLLFALRAVLVCIVFYGTYQTHYTVEFGVKGLNLITLLFVLAVLLTSSLTHKAATPVPLKGYFYAFFAALFWSFVVGQLHDPSAWVSDLAVAKNMLFAMLLYFVAYRASGDRRTCQVLFGALLCVTALVTLHVWRQALDYGIGVYNESRRASGPFGPDAAASNRAAAFFIIFLPVMLATAFYARKWWICLAALALTALGVAGVFFTYSRQAYVAIPLLFALLAFRRNVLIGLAIVAIALSYSEWAPQGVIDRIESTQVETAQGEAKLDESTESRFIIWAGAAEIIAAYPLGIGLNHFQRRIGEYVPLYPGYDAHNNYVRFTTEGGILGGVAMVALLLALLVLSVRIAWLSPSGESRLVSTAFMISVLGVIFSNMYGSRFFDADIMGAFWILAGITARRFTADRERAARTRANGAMAMPLGVR